MFVSVEAKHVVTKELVLEECCKVERPKEFSFWLKERIGSGETLWLEGDAGTSILIPANIMKDCIFTVKQVKETKSTKEPHVDGAPFHQVKPVGIFSMATGRTEYPTAEELKAKLDISCE